MRVCMLCVYVRYVCAYQVYMYVMCVCVYVSVVSGWLCMCVCYVRMWCIYVMSDML